MIARHAESAHRDSREEPSPLEPGRPYEVTFDLEAASWTFEAGHRIRLDLAGTDWPNAWTPPEPLSLTIDRAVGDADASRPGRARRPPAARPSSRHRAAERKRFRTEGSGGYDWRIERDVPTGETRAVVGNHGDYPAKPTTALVRRAIRGNGDRAAGGSRRWLCARRGLVRDAVAGSDLRSERDTRRPK